MTITLNKDNRSGYASDKLFLKNQGMIFTFAVKGLKPESTLRLSFTGQVQRITTKHLDEQGRYAWQTHPTSGAAVLMVRLEAYDDGKEIVPQEGDVIVTVEALPVPKTLLTKNKGFFAWLKSKLGG